ncbi:DUF1206 domain-containing protein [Arthrobacter sp. Br18]|uniref:DUF1206 domain-containing protein n=1 Tax=Arthrobacter sp. Br18 TaxID=1312954 RepID=UPI00047B4A34|nr:DUF1206 domain-containing protein [Arthrobacter sp. Br18]
MGQVERQVTKAADDATDSKGFILAARAGYIAAGLLHILIGAIALRIASGGSGSADQSGAVGQLAASPGGGILLWACFLGCSALALFMLSEAFFATRRLDGKEKLGRQLKFVGQAAAYGAIGATFGIYALGGSTSSSGSTQSLSASLMSNPAGSALLIAVGVGVIATGGYFIYSGATKRFRRDLAALPGGSTGRAITALGSTGYIAKGLALLVLGVLLVLATVRNNPEESTGIDGALKSLQEQPFGIWILGAVAVGLICYGAFLVVRSRYQRM